jgi:hypothetical protein
MRHEFKTAIELEVTVIAHVAPATPPRPSMDPDSPTYSDPGDTGERSVESVLLKDLKTGKMIDITDALRAEELDTLADEAYNDAEEKFNDLV